MKYDVFLSDFDGTLVRSDGTVSETNKAAIARYRAAGGIFAIVTGRMLTAIKPRLKELGLTEGLVCAYQGATIADVKTGALLKDGAFTQEAGLKALRALEQEAEHIHFYTVEDLYCNVRDEPLELYERVCNVKGIVVENEPLSSYAQRQRKRIVKVLAMAEPEQCVALCEKIKEKLGAGFCVARSAEFMLEIMPEGNGKGDAVEFLSRRFGVEKEKIAAIGDQTIDLSMIECVGGKFTVANADESLKKIARVVPSVEADGVAAALEIAMGENK